MHVEAAVLRSGGAGWVRAERSLGAKRTVGRGMGLGWDCLFVHVEAAGASMRGQAGCALWALSGPRGLWEGGWDGVGSASVCT